MTVFCTTTIGDDLQTISPIYFYHYMDDILLADPDINSVERMFGEVKYTLTSWRLQIT